MKSYIKIMRPFTENIIKALEKIAIKMPQVCVMSTPLQRVMGINVAGFGYGGFDDSMSIRKYFDAEMSEERCNSIISKSGESLGEYDFYFEWFRAPSHDNLIQLIKNIDEVMTNTNATYTIITK